MALDMFFNRTTKKGKIDLDFDKEIVHFTGHQKIRKCILNKLQISGDSAYLINEETLWKIVEAISSLRFEEDFTIDDSYAILYFMSHLEEMLVLTKQDRLMLWDFV